jgi:hypothetical protein
VGIGIVLILVIVAIVSSSQTSVVFEDDFSSQAYGWNDAGSERAGAHYNNGAYRIYAERNSGTRGGAPTGASSVYPSAPAKLSIEVDAQKLAGEYDTWYGVSCRVGADSAYAFVVGDGHLEIGKRTSSSDYQVLKVVQAPAVDADAKNHLSVNCNGDEGSVYLNLYVGDDFVEWTDSENPLPIGTVGLFVSSLEDAQTAVEVEFDNFVVKRI